MAAASISKSSTIVFVTASSVASSERLSEKEREISYSPRNWRPSGAPIGACARAPRRAPWSARAGGHSARRRRRLARERDQKPLLSFAVGPRALLEDGERADHLVADDERHEDRAADPAVLEDPVEPLQARIPAHVLDEGKPPASIGAEGDLEQALRQLGVCADEAARGGRGEAFALAQVDGHVAAVRELRDALDRGVERVCKRGLAIAWLTTPMTVCERVSATVMRPTRRLRRARAARAMNGESTSSSSSDGAPAAK